MKHRHRHEPKWLPFRWDMSRSYHTVGRAHDIKDTTMPALIWMLWRQRYEQWRQQRRKHQQWHRWR